MTEKEIDNICHIVHRVILSFFEPNEEERPFTKEELLLLSVNKAICTEIKKMCAEEERPHGEWARLDEYESVWRCSACNEVSCCKADFCPNCGADMRKEGEEE